MDKIVLSFFLLRKAGFTSLLESISTLASTQPNIDTSLHVLTFCINVIKQSSSKTMSLIMEDSCSELQESISFANVFDLCAKEREKIVELAELQIQVSLTRVSSCEEWLALSRLLCETNVYIEPSLYIVNQLLALVKPLFWKKFKALMIQLEQTVFSCLEATASMSLESSNSNKDWKSLLVFKANLTREMKKKLTQLSTHMDEQRSRFLTELEPLHVLQLDLLDIKKRQNEAVRDGFLEFLDGLAHKGQSCFSRTHADECPPHFLDIFFIVCSSLEKSLSHFGLDSMLTETSNACMTLWMDEVKTRFIRIKETRSQGK
jgi:hypothetical protein